MLRAAHYEPALMHAALALAALDRACKFDGFSAVWGFNVSSTMKPLQLYSIVFPHLRRLLRCTEVQAVETVLLCQVLIIAFETLLGHQASVSLDLMY